jgi:hypothetical protein
MTPPSDTVYVAIELSNTLWLVGTRLPGADKPNASLGCRRRDRAGNADRRLTGAYHR